MLAILNSLNAYNFPFFEPILMIFVSKLMIRRVIADKTHLTLGLLSPFTYCLNVYNTNTILC